MWTGSSPLHICVAPRERSLACRAVRSLHLSRSRSPRPHPWNRQRATASAQHAGGHCVEAPCCSCCVVLEKEAVASWCSCCVVLEKEAMASLHNVPEVAQEAERRQRRRAPPSTCVLAPSASWPPFCATEIARDLTNANGNGHPVPATDTSLANASSPLRSAAGTSTSLGCPLLHLEFQSQATSSCCYGPAAHRGSTRVCGALQLWRCRTV